MGALTHPRISRVFGSPVALPEGGGVNPPEPLPYLFTGAAPLMGAVFDSTSAIDARGVNTGTVETPIIKGIYRMNTSWKNQLNAMTGWLRLLNYPVNTIAKDNSIRSHTSQLCRGTSRAVAGSSSDEHKIWLPEYHEARPGIVCITIGDTINGIASPSSLDEILWQVDYLESVGVIVHLQTLIPTTVGGLGDSANYVANFRARHAILIARGERLRLEGKGFYTDAKKIFDTNDDCYHDNGAVDTWDGYHLTRTGAYKMAKGVKAQMIEQRVMDPSINIFNTRRATMTNLAPVYTQSGGARANPVLSAGSVILGGARMAGSAAGQLTTAVASTVLDPVYGWIQRLTITPNLTESQVNFQMTLASAPQTIAGLTGKWLISQARMRTPNRPGIGVPSFQLVNVADTPVTSVAMYAVSGTGGLAAGVDEAVEWCIEADPIQFTGDTLRWTFQFNGDMTREADTTPFVVDFIPPEYFEVPDPQLTVGSGVN